MVPFKIFLNGEKKPFDLDDEDLKNNNIILSSANKKEYKKYSKKITKFDTKKFEIDAKQISISIIFYVKCAIINGQTLIPKIDFRVENDTLFILLF